MQWINIGYLSAASLHLLHQLSLPSRSEETQVSQLLFPCAIQLWTHSYSIGCLKYLFLCMLRSFSCVTEPSRLLPRRICRENLIVAAGSEGHFGCSVFLLHLCYCSGHLSSLSFFFKPFTFSLLHFYGFFLITDTNKCSNHYMSETLLNRLPFFFSRFGFLEFVTVLTCGPDIIKCCRFHFTLELFLLFVFYRFCHPISSSSLFSLFCSTFTSALIPSLCCNGLAKYEHVDITWPSAPPNSYLCDARWSFLIYYFFSNRKLNNVQVAYSVCPQKHFPLNESRTDYHHILCRVRGLYACTI